MSFQRKCALIAIAVCFVASQLASARGIPEECGKNEVLSEGSGQPWCQNVCNEEPKNLCTADIYYGCVCKEGYTRLYYEEKTLGPCVARCPKPGKPLK
ncbi:hypothetical protein DdX_13847 [Ditylenchus destructor]|uniref:TIL domain-containing protein n=1 Tax=Ditylenchus destructor TaxID=166010 RepID=A0AAD4MSV2_9BILA|nr:hypothetical protein DdX_13847 [Ditylenchus destructor]